MSALEISLRAGLIASALVFISARHGIKNRKIARLEIPKLLSNDWVTGRELRKRLRARGADMSYISFYLFMEVFCAEGKARSRDTTEVVEGERLDVRMFRLA